MSHSFSRRQLIRSSVLATIGGILSAESIAHGVLLDFSSPNPDPLDKFKVGIASYTFRKLNLDDTIKALQKLGIRYISIKDFHLALTSSTADRKMVIQKLKDAGITALSCGNITMENDEQNVRNAFEYAKDCNIPTIVCSPHPDSMPLLDKMVKEYNIRLAIHNHGPEDKRFPSPYDVWKAVKGYDNRIGLCIDVGHTARAKVNPAEAILKCKERLYDLHFKDITSTEATGTTTAAGRGVLNLPSVLRALVKIHYSYLLSIEYENTPDDAIPPVAETLGYMKGVLAMVK
ncbi:MAG TPA: sugar phosphate isomerase/epimerase [Flavitalea sp.]|nr:sugar phosphate isomerase/epimerase [Flavitalea sp.]